MRYILKCKTAFKNNEEEPDPFYAHVAIGGGVEKSFLINVTTGKATCHINWLT